MFRGAEKKNFPRDFDRDLLQVQHNQHTEKTHTNQNQKWKVAEKSQQSIEYFLISHEYQSNLNSSEEDKSQQ